MAENNLEVCENCGRQIGKLEKSMIWEEHVVCRECRDHLVYTLQPDAARPTYLNTQDTGDADPHPPGLTKRDVQSAVFHAILDLMFLLFLIVVAIAIISVFAAPTR